MPGYTANSPLVVEQRVAGAEPRFVLVPPHGSLMLPCSYDALDEALRAAGVAAVDGTVLLLRDGAAALTGLHVDVEAMS